MLQKDRCEQVWSHPSGLDMDVKLMYMFFFKKNYLLILDRGEERERNINVWLPLVHPPLGTCSATQACALTGN